MGMSQQIRLDSYLSRFGFLVACPAQADQVIQCVCLFVVQILVWEVIEAPKWLDVVYIHLAAVLLSGLAAHLAAVAIALAGKALLFSPVGAIVVNAPALPRIIVGSRKCFAHPLVFASFTAKVHPARFGANPSGVSLDGGTAGGAMRLNGFLPVRVAIPTHVYLAPLVPALSATKEVLISSHLRRVALNFFAALRALDAYHCAFVGGGSGSNLGGLPRSAAGVIAKLVRRVSRPVRLSDERCAAVIALSFDRATFGCIRAWLGAIAALLLVWGNRKLHSANFAAFKGLGLAVGIVDSALPFGSALNRAEIQGFNLRQWAVNLFAAMVTVDCLTLALGGHKKTSCRRVSWNACRGRTTADRRQYKLYHCGIPTNNCNTLDMGNYTTPAGVHQ